MSDAQQGLPRYTGTGAFGKVADALNLHSGCIEDLDATGMVSNARYSGRGGSVIAKPRAPRSGSANHAGDFKRFALRIARDTDGDEKLFIGKGGVQVDDGVNVWREEIAATKKTLIEDGEIYVEYDPVMEEAALVYFNPDASPPTFEFTTGRFYAGIGVTKKDTTTGEWLLPEQWLTTDAFYTSPGTNHPFKIRVYTDETETKRVSIRAGIVNNTLEVAAQDFSFPGSPNPFYPAIYVSFTLNSDGTVIPDDFDVTNQYDPGTSAHVTISGSTVTVACFIGKVSTTNGVTTVEQWITNNFFVIPLGMQKQMWYA